MPTQILCTAFRELWSSNSTRSLTLARLVQHKRQIEGWWKCELAAHLWDYAAKIDGEAHVWMEAPDRADIAIACGTGNKNGVLAPATGDGRTVIPMELKTVGTFWGGGAGVEKAYREPGKKRLEQDMVDAQRGRRPAYPFSVVALLVTHAGTSDDAVLKQYLRRARELGEQHELKMVLDEAVSLPTIPDMLSTAHQFAWTAMARSSAV